MAFDRKNHLKPPKYALFYRKLILKRKLLLSCGSAEHQASASIHGGPGPTPVPSEAAAEGEARWREVGKLCPAHTSGRQSSQPQIS